MHRYFTVNYIIITSPALNVTSHNGLPHSVFIVKNKGGLAIIGN